jgi:hypothetical protein
VAVNDLAALQIPKAGFPTADFRNVEKQASFDSTPQLIPIPLKSTAKSVPHDDS